MLAFGCNSSHIFRIFLVFSFKAWRGLQRQIVPGKTSRRLMLYSQTKGVKQKYILCILGLVAYRQYIHNCSSRVDPRLAHGSESNICSSALLGWSPLSRAWLRCGSPLLSLVSAMTHRHLSRLLSPQLVDSSPSHSPYKKGTSLRLLSPLG